MDIRADLFDWDSGNQTFNDPIKGFAEASDLRWPAGRFPTTFDLICFVGNKPTERVTVKREILSEMGASYSGHGQFNRYDITVFND